jgi:hypothetical protein
VPSGDEIWGIALWQSGWPTSRQKALLKYTGNGNRNFGYQKIMTIDTFRRAFS